MFRNLVIPVVLHQQNSRDNMSVVLVAFPGAPKVSTEAIEKVMATSFTVFLCCVSVLPTLPSSGQEASAANCRGNR